MDEKRSRHVMATPSTSAPGRATVARATVALVVVVGVLLAAIPAQAAPPETSQEVAALIAARADELETVTEQVNQAQDRLSAQLAAAEGASAAVAQSQASLAGAQAQVRGIARSAFTGDGMSAMRALLTSESADEFVFRVSTLQTVSGYQNEIVGKAAAASVAAAQDRAVAQQAADEARAQVDAVAAQQADLRAQVEQFRAQFDALSAAEQRQVSEAADPAGNRASRSERPASVASGAPVPASSQAAQIAVDTAMAQRGKPYEWGATGPNSFDCSGLLVYSYRAAGITLPRSSGAQAAGGRQVSRDELQPGDLVYFYNPVSHIGMYIGNGQMVHSSTFGQPVKVSSIDSMGSGAYRGGVRYAG